MSDRPSLDQGDTAVGERVNPVRLQAPQLDQNDKTVLCSAVCHCSAAPAISRDGRNLKQVCVAQHLRALDDVLQQRSPYKPEVSYDMTKQPPQPILDSQTGQLPHGWIPGWIRKYWDEDPEHPPFVPGSGMIRRPDVVIVRDPRNPPTQDNIKQVVEMKFPPDPFDERQIQIYAQISGSPRRVVQVSSDECNCGRREQLSEIPIKEMGWAAAVAGSLLFILTRGRFPSRTAPAY
ncbi:VRR-NUC domain-containing protein [Pseudomonas sp. K1(2024)]|uniref:VRR-NUC domain-containing protein n=1 Tax=Pseudomonas boreofloridensis TaxID=3064348 RepID=A0ABV4Z5Y9_9PSED|nr:VRR-NUC domain-containing protein [Pseudomonas sp. K13]MDO7901898.1 VRR-NUC domain-containing protein [Pseudomonas sp. K13]